MSVTSCSDGVMVSIIIVSGHFDHGLLTISYADNLKSTMHRVGLPPRQDRFTGDVRMTRARYSIPYFVSPEGPTVVEVLPSCTDADHPAKYQPIRWNDYMLMRASMQYEDKPAPVEVSG